MFDPVEMLLVSRHWIQLIILRNITTRSRFKQAQRTDDGRIKPKLLVVFEERPVCMLWMSGSHITVRQPRRQSHLLRGIQDDTRPIDIIVAHDIHLTTVEVLPLSLTQDATSRTTGQGNIGIIHRSALLLSMPGPKCLMLQEAAL